ncbi:hypothetical protein OIU78_009042 [Salix suchowensis]|nr:hypothetical protein OIU78_009042 [Salix suchowensis]
MTTQQKPVTSWAERVRVTNSTTRFSLDQIPRNIEGSKLHIEDDSFMNEVDQWTRCLVGFFPGFRISFSAVNTIASRIWKHSGLEHVMATSNGFFLFRFKKESDLQEILRKGPWMFGGKTIVLQQWHPHFGFDKNKIASLPVWIRLKGLPFPLWTTQGLSQAASMVGKPMAYDEHTHNCTRLDYARVCVEVDAALPYVHKFEIECTLSAAPISIEVEFEWKPQRCEKCKVFGHSCTSKPLVKLATPPLVGNDGAPQNPTAVTVPNPTTNDKAPITATPQQTQNATYPNPTDTTRQATSPKNATSPKTATSPNHVVIVPPPNPNEASTSQTPTSPCSRNHACTNTQATTKNHNSGKSPQKTQPSNPNTGISPQKTQPPNHETNRRGDSENTPPPTANVDQNTLPLEEDPTCLENKMASLQSESKCTSRALASVPSQQESDTGSNTPSKAPPKGQEPSGNGRDTSPSLSWSTVRKRKGGRKKREV